MKRSQMINEIVNVLRDTFLLTDEVIAGAILSKVESLGMKPPVEKTDDVLFRTEYTWEEENA